MKKFLTKATFNSDRPDEFYKKDCNYLLDMIERGFWERFFDGAPGIQISCEGENHVFYANRKQFLKEWRVITSTNPSFPRTAGSSRRLDL